MIQERAWPVRAMYILIAAALAISLFIAASPSQKVSAASDEVKAEWTRVDTPTTHDWVLAPNSTIIDYALTSDGAVVYAIVDSYYGEVIGDYYLLKSDDGAATWDDITDALEKVDDVNTINPNGRLLRVETDGMDPDFVAVAVYEAGEVRVYFSTDGGDTFNDASEVRDGTVTLNYGAPNYGVSDIEVSPEAAGKRDIAVLGMSNTAPGAGVFRSTVTGDTASAWEDATAYDGWDNRWSGDSNTGNDIYSGIVTEGEFSPNWATDKTFLVTTVEQVGPSAYDVYLQSGSWGLSAGWNEKSSLGIEAVPIIQNVNMPTYLIGWDARGLAGLTLPSDYNSKSTDTRVLWVWVNYYDPVPPNYPASRIVRVDNDDSAPVIQQVKDGKLWLTNVDYRGTIAEGEALAGVLGTGTDYGGPFNLFTSCCEGVQVYRNTGIHDMDICCQRWLKACKPPTGRVAMAVSFVSDDKAYAVALQGDVPGAYYDEGAWSVTFDVGDTWNQLSLIDTRIDYLSDVEVSPDCNKMMLVSVNGYGEDCGCDSVWLKATSLAEAPEYSGKWLRTWCGALTGTYWGETGPYAGFLRLAATETTGDTVYLVDYGTSNVYRNDLETLGCWTSVASTTLDNIVDLVATDADTLYALDYSGDVSLYDSEGWHEAVDSKVSNGWTIAVHGSDILVGGAYDGDVSYSDDGGETFALLQDKDGNDVMTPIPGHVTVAFDAYFDTNSVIYAAVEGFEMGWEGGIYRWVIGTSDAWKDTGAYNGYGYTGLVVTNGQGNPYTSADTGGVLYASYVGELCNTDEYYWDYEDCWKAKGTEECWYTGVARSLNPSKIVECMSCVEWDYLTVGLDSYEGFQATPKALKICGCLTPDSNSKLFAIDSWSYRYNDGYDMDKAQTGTVWTFEDCYAKKAPDVTSPSGNVTIPADPCSCYNAPFSITWDGLCDACHYELQFALDEDFNTAMGTISVPPEGSTSITSYLVPGGESAALLSCETTYYLRVRAIQAGTCQIIRSWWSDPIKITIAPSIGAAKITLIAPEATDVARTNVAFSWSLLAEADAFDWVLSPNADLSSAIATKTGLTATACTYTGTALSYDTPYYWQVTAYKGGVVVSRSDIGTFRTVAETVTPPPTPAAPTPFWVWVVIAIGAVLVIVVIVLIFRTRRV
jgi:hypothetical protein